MGRTKGKHLHTAAKELVRKISGSFSEDFSKNKAKLKELNIIGESKKELNKLAGEVTILMHRARPKTKPVPPAVVA